MEEVDGNHVVFISGRWILDDLSYWLEHVGTNGTINS
jgi:hypothetical protein